MQQEMFCKRSKKNRIRLNNFEKANTHFWGTLEFQKCNVSRTKKTSIKYLAENNTPSVNIHFSACIRLNISPPHYKLLFWICRTKSGWIYDIRSRTMREKFF